MVEGLASEAAEKCSSHEEHRTPAPEQAAEKSHFLAIKRGLSGLKPNPIFSGLAVCLKAYPDTKRDFCRKL